MENADPPTAIDRPGKGNARGVCRPSRADNLELQEVPNRDSRIQTGVRKDPRVRENRKRRNEGISGVVLPNIDQERRFALYLTTYLA